MAFVVDLVDVFVLVFFARGPGFVSISPHNRRIQRMHVNLSGRFRRLGYLLFIGRYLPFILLTGDMCILFI